MLNITTFNVSLELLVIVLISFSQNNLPTLDPKPPPPNQFFSVYVMHLVLGTSTQIFHDQWFPRIRRNTFMTSNASQSLSNWQD